MKTYKSIEYLEKDLDDMKWHWWEYPEIWWHRYFWNWFSSLKWRIPNWWQRSLRGWGYADTWGLCDFLAKVIYGSLVHLKRYKQGYPITIVPEKVENPNKDIDYELNEKVWSEIMDKMIYAFKLANDIAIGEKEQYMPKMDEKFQKKYKCLTEKEHYKMQEGMGLFVKYFWYLWS